MHKLLATIKFLLHAMVLIIVVGGIFIYIAMHFNLAGIITKDRLIERLCYKLQTNVEVENVEVNWLNQIAINNIIVFDQCNDTLFRARRAMVGFELIPLLQKKLVINTVQLIDYGLNIKQDSLGAIPNYAFLIEALAPRQEDKQRHFINDASLHALFLRRGNIEYNILNKPDSLYFGTLDPYHLKLQDVSASLSVEISHITGLEVLVKRLSFKEYHGTEVESLKAHCFAYGNTANLNDISIQLCHPLDDYTKGKLKINGTASVAGDSIFTHLKTIHAEGMDWGEIDCNAIISGHISSPNSLHGQIEFWPSKLEQKSIRYIKNQRRIPIPRQIKQVSLLLNELNWQGVLKFNTFSNLSYLGSIETKGKLNTTIVCETQYNEGIWDGSRFDGSYHLTDKYCQVNGASSIILNKENILLSFNSKLRNFNPYSLQLTRIKNFKDLVFNGETHGNVTIPIKLLNQKTKKKQYIDNSKIPTGHIHIDSLRICSSYDTICLDPIRLNIEPEGGSFVGILQSQIANIVITPTAMIGAIPEFPELSKIFSLPGYLNQKATFMAEWDSIHNQIKLEGSIPEWIVDNDKINISFSSEGKTLNHLPIPETLLTTLHLGYNTPKHNLETDLEANLNVTPFSIDIKPSVVKIDQKNYMVKEAFLLQNTDGNFILKDFKIQENDQILYAFGNFKGRKELNLFIDLQQFKSDFLFDILNKGYLNFGGYATGQLHFSSDSVFHLETHKMNFDKFSYIGDTLGTAEISCLYDIDNKRINLDADILSKEGHSTQASGWIHLGEKDSLDLLFDADSLNIDFIKYWLGGILQDMHGHTTGKIHLFGDCDSLNIIGHPFLHNVNFTYDLLGGRYIINDTLHMTHGDQLSDGFINLKNAHLYDSNGQLAYISLDLNHKHLHQMEYGVDIDIPNTNDGFLIFNHPNQIDNALYWGKLWATGRCQMHGTYSRHRISAQLSPAGKSIFNLSPGEENFSENKYNFLTFRDKRTLNYNDIYNPDSVRVRTFINNEKKEPIFVEADLLIHANERCQVYVQMDPLAEDRLVCKGNGDLSLHYDPYHDITLTGTYDMSQGAYTVNMRGDLMTKSFRLQEGSRVTFTGIPSEAMLDLNAVYNIPSANLRDLDESFSSLASLSRTSLPVDCKLNVSGSLTAPQIAFDLEVKNASDDVQALVHNIIGTQEMLNREVFYLLLFSKFYTPEYASTSQRQTGSELTSFASSSLTSQLNNLLGHMSDNFTLGTNFRSDKGDFSDMEMDLSLSTRLLNDRLLLNGNLGYRDPANRIGLNNSNTSFIGDFDVEFLVNTSGTVRAKAYSHYNERDYSINNALTTQGIGIILRKDFKTLKDLLNRQH